MSESADHRQGRKLWTRQLVSRGASILLLIYLLASVASGRSGASGASLPCPGSTAAFGSQFHVGTCTIGTDTTCANGTFVLRGDLVVSPGFHLRLTNLTLRFDPAVEQEWRLLDGGSFLVRGG